MNRNGHVCLFLFCCLQPVNTALFLPQLCLVFSHACLLCALTVNSGILFLFFFFCLSTEKPPSLEAVSAEQSAIPDSASTTGSQTSTWWRPSCHCDRARRSHTTPQQCEHHDGGHRSAHWDTGTRGRHGTYTDSSEDRLTFYKGTVYLHTHTYKKHFFLNHTHPLVAAIAPTGVQ